MIPCTSSYEMVAKAAIYPGQVGFESSLAADEVLKLGELRDDRLKM